MAALCVLPVAGCKKKESPPAEPSADAAWSPSEDGGYDSTDYYVVSPDGSRLRAEPSVESETVAVIPYGARLSMIDHGDGTEEIGGVEGCWIKTEYEGDEGWIFTGYLGREDPEGDSAGKDGWAGEDSDLDSMISGSSWIDVTEEERLGFEANLEEFPGMRMFFFKNGGLYQSYISNSGFGEEGIWKTEGSSIIIGGEAATEADEWEIDMELRVSEVTAFALSGEFARSDGSGVRVAFKRLDNPLAAAAAAGDTAALRGALAPGLDVDTPLYGDLRALMYAAYNGNEETLSWLLDRGADPNAKDAKNETALHFAAANGQKGAARLLIEAGADANARSDFDHTPAELARERGHGELADYLDSARASG